MRAYTESKEQSAEILRIAIQKMSQHPAPYTPFCYAVWYEYAAGLNSQLVDEVNEHIKNKEAITGELIETLYVNYVAEDEKKVREAQSAISDLLSQVQETTRQAGETTGSLGGSLANFGELIQSSTDPDAIKKMVGNMAVNVDSASCSVASVNKQLTDQQNVIALLQAELNKSRGEAITDPLSGLYNRRGLEQMAAPLLKKGGACMIAIDIDHFKRVNDTYGHLFGDKVIKMVAQAVRAKVRGADVTARIGGEEFVVLLPETTLMGAFVVAENIRQSIEKVEISYVNDGKVRNRKVAGFSVSIGIAAQTAKDTLKTLIGHADQALYKSKHSGRNKTTTYGSGNT